MESFFQKNGAQDIFGIWKVQAFAHFSDEVVCLLTLDLIYVSFAILIDVTHVCVIVIVAVVFVVFVVVYNVVVFSGEDIGGQMREMAIFGVPCWGLMVSEGVPGSNDRAGEGQLPQSGHASLNTGKIYAPPWVALLFSSSGVGTGRLPVEALCLVYSIAVSLLVNNATAMLSLF